MSLDLNQIEAVKFPIGPAMVIAGPGSGKTTVLTQRVRYMIKELNIPPEQILVITFTRAAALQMKKRFDETSEDYYPVTFSTFHSLFYSVIRDASSDDISLITPKEKLNILISVLKDKSISFDLLNLNSLLNEFTEKKLLREKKSSYSSKILDQSKFDLVFDAYNQETKMLNKLEFDDFSERCMTFLQNPLVRNKWKERYKYCLIDEFQDISFDQYEIIKTLFDKNVYAVGDDDQSIYGFRGAKPSVCFEFVKDYDAKILRLNNNYRSTPKIVEMSSFLIKNNKERFDKNLVSQKKEEGCATLLKYLNFDEEYEDLLLKLDDCKGENITNAILLRTNSASEKLLGKLIKKGYKPVFKDKPDDVFQTGIAKDVIAYLKLSRKEYTYENLFRIANKPNRYVSRAYLTECKNNELIYNDCFSFKNLYETAKGKSYLKTNIYKFEMSLKKMWDMDSFEALIYIFNVVGYENYLRESGIKNKDAFEKMKSVAMEYPDISDFVDFCENIGGQTNNNVLTKEDYKKGNIVEIATIHSSKGLEWDNVFIPDIIEGNLPHKKTSFDDIEEERRLLYVGMTRAKMNLWLGYVDNPDEKAIPSVFVKELI